MLQLGLFSRRKLLGIGALLPVALTGRATESASLWATHQGCQAFFFRPPVDDAAALMGTAAPSEKEIVTAFDLLWNAPRDKSAMEIAKHIADKASLVENDDGEPYNREWAVRANPLIVYTFAMTQTLPSGDTTPWCAAFVNFCLFAASKLGTKHAGSATFRTYGVEVNNPEPGDIVVFQDKMTSWKGHVAFLSERFTPGDNRLSALGGNQSNEIKASIYPMDGDRLRFHSFRRIP